MKILVAFKSIITGMDMLEQAARQAEAFGGEVHVVRSLYGGDPDEAEKVIEAESNLESAKQYLNLQGVKNFTHVLVRGLSPGEDIITFARENDIELIVITVRKRSKVGKLIFGSTAQHVILEAECPVLSVR